MSGFGNITAPEQAVREHYRKWLEATVRQRSDFNGVLFARRVTNLGRDRFMGMTELEICKVIGANVTLAGTSWAPPPFIRVGTKDMPRAADDE